MGPEIPTDTSQYQHDTIQTHAIVFPDLFRSHQHQLMHSGGNYGQRRQLSIAHSG